METYRIEWAAQRDVDEIYTLYHSLINTPYSTWSEDYPTKEDVQKTIRYLKKNEFKEKDGLRSEKCGITQKLYIKEMGTN